MRGKGKRRGGRPAQVAEGPSRLRRCSSPSISAPTLPQLYSCAAHLNPQPGSTLHRPPRLHSN